MYFNEHFFLFCLIFLKNEETAMDQKKQDRRIMRTKKKLQEALTELMETKGFDAIKIHDLTEKADINRGTFYLHYKDKFDLLEQSEDDIIQEIVHIHKEGKKHEGKKSLAIKLPIEEPMPNLVELFSYIKANEALLRVLLGKRGNQTFQEKLKTVLRENMLEHILELHLEKSMLVPLEYFTAFAVSAHIGVIQQWIENGLDKSPKEMALILTRITFHHIIQQQQDCLQKENHFKNENTHV